ncbi:PHP domain-containing protein [Kribbella sindirgiensis]|uniref:Histidinol-phosphatase n=1 Tax=Kribbella sindirgiensis TaxID=1124744 RepID=A0A4R0I8P1_9ACTN|nr:PHP domain-containing protein [Kribbella sindirgiensis]
MPADNHVHSQWSWDALHGSMEATCEHAAELGVPALTFTDHADFTPWTIPAGTELPSEWRTFVRGGILTPPALDLDGYLQSLEHCRERFPGLRIRSGVEISDPHWHLDSVQKLLAAAEFDLVISAVHSMTTGGGLGEVALAYDACPAAEVVHEYLAETLRMIEQYDGFDVLAHLDYPIRYWPNGEPFDAGVFEEEFRTVLRALAAGGKALEINTKVPLSAQILRWWYAEGGAGVTFGSDAHEAGALARGFAEAVAIAEDCGFRPGPTPWSPWVRDLREPLRAEVCE